MRFNTLYMMVLIIFAQQICFYFEAASLQQRDAKEVQGQSVSIAQHVKYIRQISNEQCELMSHFLKKDYNNLWNMSIDNIDSLLSWSIFMLQSSLPYSMQVTWINHFKGKFLQNYARNDYDAKTNNIEKCREMIRLLFSNKYPYFYKENTEDIFTELIKIKEFKDMLSRLAKEEFFFQELESQIAQYKTLVSTQPYYLMELEKKYDPKNGAVLQPKCTILQFTDMTVKVDDEQSALAKALEILKRFTRQQYALFKLVRLKNTLYCDNKNNAEQNLEKGLVGVWNCYVKIVSATQCVNKPTYLAIMDSIVYDSRLPYQDQLPCKVKALWIKWAMEQFGGLTVKSFLQFFECFLSSSQSINDMLPLFQTFFPFFLPELLKNPENFQFLGHVLFKMMRFLDNEKNEFAQIQNFENNGEEMDRILLHNSKLVTETQKRLNYHFCNLILDLETLRKYVNVMLMTIILNENNYANA